MKKIFVVFIVLILAYGCVPQLVVRRTVGGYDGKTTDIRSLLNIDGYYRITKTLRKSDKQGVVNIDTSRYWILLYDDGTIFVSSGRTNDAEYIPAFLKKAAENPKSKDVKWFYSSMWGRYSIEGDTIKAFVVTAYTLNQSSGGITWYKIIDRNTLIEISSEFIENKAEQERYRLFYEDRRARTTSYPSHFVPLTTIPPSDCWLKKKNWFWAKGIRKENHN